MAIFVASPLFLFSQIKVSVDTAYVHPYNLNCIMLQLIVTNKHNQDIYLKKNKEIYTYTNIVFESIDSFMNDLDPNNEIAIITIKNYLPIDSERIGFFDYFPEINKGVIEFQNNFFFPNKKIKSTTFQGDNYYLIESNTSITFNIILDADFFINQMEAAKILSEKEKVAVSLQIPLNYITATDKVGHKIRCSTNNYYFTKAVLDQFHNLIKK